MIIDATNIGDDWVVISKNLYHVQDSDRPMYVIAKDYQEAIALWQKLVGDENNCDPLDCDPSGISLIADDDDLIISQ